MLVYYFGPFIVSNRYLLLWVSNGHNSVTVQNRTHVYMNFFWPQRPRKSPPEVMPWSRETPCIISRRDLICGPIVITSDDQGCLFFVSLGRRVGVLAGWTLRARFWWTFVLSSHFVEVCWLERKLMNLILFLCGVTTVFLCNARKEW